MSSRTIDVTRLMFVGHEKLIQILTRDFMFEDDEMMVRHNGIGLQSKTCSVRVMEADDVGVRPSGGSWGQLGRIRVKWSSGF